MLPMSDTRNPMPAAFDPQFMPYVSGDNAQG